MRFHHLPEVPDGLRTERLVLRPIVAADAAADYEAVMESREQLRPWEQSGWPAEGFTLQEDLADVIGLEQRHAAQDAFTYTVLDPADDRCLGCVYLMPPDARDFARASITPVHGAGSWAEQDVAVYFWVRTSVLADGVDGLLLDALRERLAGDWPYTAPVFVTNEQVPQQVALLEQAGLRLRFRLTREDWAGDFLAYG